MRKIVPIVEGDGEVEAVPVLIQKVLSDISRSDAFVADRPKNAHGVGGLTRSGGVERMLSYALLGNDVAGILVLRDADRDCPRLLAADLARRARKLKPPVPVSIVIAKCEYEA